MSNGRTAVTARLRRSPWRAIVAVSLFLQGLPGMADSASAATKFGGESAWSLRPSQAPAVSLTPRLPGGLSPLASGDAALTAPTLNGLTAAVAPPWALSAPVPTAGLAALSAVSAAQSAAGPVSAIAAASALNPAALTPGRPFSDMADVVYDRGVLGPAADGTEEAVDAAAFSSEIAAQKAALASLSPEDPITKVFVLSMSLDWDTIKEIKAIDQYESRLLAALLEADNPKGSNKPDTNVIFVTPTRVPKYAIDHILRKHPRKKDILSRVTFIALSDFAKSNDKNGSVRRSLAAKLNSQEYRGALDAIDQKIKEIEHRAILERPAGGKQKINQRTIMVSYVGEKNEWEIAQKLRIPLVSPHYSLLKYGTKTGSREIIEAVMPESVLPGYKGISSIAELKEKVEALWSKGISEVVMKTEKGASGKGNWNLPLPAWMESPSDRREWIDRRFDEIARDRDGGKWLRLFARQGGIVEKFETRRVISSPSGQGEVVQSEGYISDHEQITTKQGAYNGALYPAKRRYRRLVQEMTLRIGRELAKRGVVGRFAVDYIAVEDEAGGISLIPIEINLRMGGTTHPFYAAQLLTGATINKQGELRLGRRKIVYNASDHTMHPGLRGISIRKFLKYFEDKGVLFDHETKTGVVFHMLDGVKTDGNVGYTVIARNRRQADAIERRLKKLLRQLEEQRVNARRR